MSQYPCCDQSGNSLFLPPPPSTLILTNIKLEYTKRCRRSYQVRLKEKSVSTVSPQMNKMSLDVQLFVPPSGILPWTCCTDSVGIEWTNVCLTYLAELINFNNLSTGTIHKHFMFPHRHPAH